MIWYPNHCVDFVCVANKINLSRRFFDPLLTFLQKMSKKGVKKFEGPPLFDFFHFFCPKKSEKESKRDRVLMRIAPFFCTKKRELCASACMILPSLRDGKIVSIDIATRCRLPSHHRYAMMRRRDERREARCMIDKSIILAPAYPFFGDFSFKK